MTDEEAIRMCQEGNRDAFHHLVEQYKDTLYGTAVLMMGNRSSADDHVQEAFLSAWRGIGKFRREARSSRGWCEYSSTPL